MWALGVLKTTLTYTLLLRKRLAEYKTAQLTLTFLFVISFTGHCRSYFRENLYTRKISYDPRRENKLDISHEKCKTIIPRTK